MVRRYLFIIIIVIISASLVATESADTEPYVPQPNAHFFDYVNKSVRAKCRASNIGFSETIYPDVMPYTSDAPPSLHVYRIAKNADVKRSALVVCGFSARGFITSDLCVNLLDQWCSGDLNMGNDIVYTVIPVANERGRDLVVNLWDAFKGYRAFDYGSFLAATPEAYHLAMKSLLPPSSAKPIQCYDGSIRMTLLQNNWPMGWTERSTLPALSPLETLPIHTREGIDAASQSLFRERMTNFQQMSTPDLISDHGAVPLSDPEVRIINLVMRQVAASIVISVNLGHSAILVPFDSPLLSADYLQASESADTKTSLTFAKSVGCGGNGDCRIGIGMQERRYVEPDQTGTLVDHAKNIGVQFAFTVQMFQRDASAEQQTAANAHQDCLVEWMPRTDGEAKQVFDRWSPVVAKLCTVK